jgi:hypothetical protein
MVRDGIEADLLGFHGRHPFDHAVIDGFLEPALAGAMLAEFPAEDDPCWHRYDNALELKSACNDWNRFGPATYRAFSYLVGSTFTAALGRVLGINGLTADAGLHGGGWHFHGSGGRLNPHLDYSLHPRLGLKRKLNLIFYLSADWQPGGGGEFGMWRAEGERAGELVKTVEPIFNRAVLFDTTQDSWHGLASPVAQSRRSLGVYYLVPADHTAPRRSRALFSPTYEQRGDPAVATLIERRAAEATASGVWRD